jgi:hypothetical protein
MQQNLREKFDALLRIAPCGVALGPAHKSLSPLWSLLVKYSSTKKPFSHPSLFDWFASISITDAALIGDVHQTSSETLLPEFPLVVNGQFSNTLGVFLSYLSNIKEGIPIDLRIEDERLPVPLFNRLTEILLQWVTKCIDSLSTPEAFMACDPDCDQLLRMIRSIAFVYGINQYSSLLKGHMLYHRLNSILGATSIINYMRMVLKPIVSTILFEVPRENKELREMVLHMEGALDAWLKFIPNAAAELCKASSCFSLITIV